jgi:prepilin-type N-terminal cleavage/methylation domain-containing protein
MTNDKNHKLAFSLIELSVVILIIGILIIGVSKGSAILTKSKLQTAQSLTNNSPVASTSGLSLWLETTLDKSFPEGEALNSTAISTWNDINPRTSSTKNAIAGTSPNYLEDGINGLPVLTFDQTASEFMTLPTASSLGIVGSAYEIFIVYQSTVGSGTAQYVITGSEVGEYELELNGASTTGKIRFLSGDGLPNRTILEEVSPSPLSAHMISMRVDSAAAAIATLRIDGSADNVTIIEAVDATSSATGALRIGGRDGFGPYDGHIGEIIIFNKALSTSERTDIEEYLSSKWGITI